MRKILLFVAAITVCTTMAYSQKTKVRESVEKIADGKNNALIVNIPGADENDIIKAWRDKLKDADAKVSGKGSMFADDASIIAISNNTIDIYSFIKEKGDAIELMVAFNLGGAFLNSKDHPAGFKAAQSMMRDFAVEQAKNAVNKKIEKQTNVINKLTKNKENLEKENKKLANDIENYKKKIENAENDISKNKSEIESEIKNIDTETKKLKDLERSLNDID